MFIVSLIFILSSVLRPNGCTIMELILFHHLLLMICLSSAKVFIDRFPGYELNDDITENAVPINSKPLFITPFLENKTSVLRIQKMAFVNHPELSAFPSYSGFFTVNKTTESNMFFWYFPAAVKSGSAPVVLWLQGGPGASSLFGLLKENGPFDVTKLNKAKARKYSWHTTHNVIYIDNPVGAGFSFVNKNEGYARNEVDVGTDLYSAMQQFFTLFPKLRRNDFFITGESYAGKYVPALAYTIHNHFNGAQPPAQKINLKGLAIGNGFVDPYHQLKYGNYLFSLGLIDAKTRDWFFKIEMNARECIKKTNFGCALKAFDSLMDKYEELSGGLSYYNYLVQSADDSDVPLKKFLKRRDIRKAIHVGDLPFDEINMKVYDFLRYDMMDTMAPVLSELLSHYRVCIYNGQLDIIVGYPLTVNFLSNLSFTHAKQYKNATRHVWKVGKDVAGYVHEAGNLLEIMVRDAGHMVPRDQPKWSYDLINRFTAGKRFY